MHTSSSANRTCSDSRSASEYTATVSMPSSRQARMTRSAISPRLAMRTLRNIARYDAARARALTVLEARPARVARRGHALHAQRELARVAREEQRALVRDDALRIPAHDRLVEALHPVLDGALADEVGNVERILHVADLVLHGGRVDQHL